MARTFAPPRPARRKARSLVSPTKTRNSKSWHAPGAHSGMPCRFYLPPSVERGGELFLHSPPWSRKARRPPRAQSATRRESRPSPRSKCSPCPRRRLERPDNGSRTACPPLETPPNNVCRTTWLGRGTLRRRSGKATPFASSPRCRRLVLSPGSSSGLKPATRALEIQPNSSVSSWLRLLNENWKKYAISRENTHFSCVLLEAPRPSCL